ncbi:WXG100 family type VII secretion target [Nocardioides aequoreus]|uniref:WXG100 family type VII secretion target n=1 Tax=Nocardioides aequoreus TaxID=397278 RepID=UPI0004C43212|nr:WXG100 family type VII secretion target [Nocardioides aequoreus]
MNTGNLKVQFGSLEAASADIAGSANKLEARIDQLESELAPMRASWEGEAQAAYIACKAKWDQGMRDIKLLLGEIGTAVATSNADYQATEKANAGRWA